MTIDITWRVWHMLTPDQQYRLNNFARNNQRLDMKSYRPTRSKSREGQVVVQLHDPRTGRFFTLHPSGIVMRDVPTDDGQKFVPKHANI